MPLPLAIQYTKAAPKYLEALDAPTKKRMIGKIKDIAKAPEDLRLSYPLSNSAKRSTKIGKYRILMVVIGEETLLVSDIGSRGQIYDNA